MIFQKLFLEFHAKFATAAPNNWCQKRELLICSWREGGGDGQKRANAVYSEIPGGPGRKEGGVGCGEEFLGEDVESRGVERWKTRDEWRSCNLY